jgi:hypothetical protein
MWQRTGGLARRLAELTWLVRVLHFESSSSDLQEKWLSYEMSYNLGLIEVFGSA